MLGGNYPGTTGTSTAVGATSLTDSGASWTTNALTGCFIVTGSVFSVVLSNTASVASVGQWQTPGASDAAASTPSTGTYNVLPGNAPAWYMALSTDTTAVATGDTTLPSEITTAGGGLVAKRATYAHTTSAASYTLTGQFTGNGSDSYSVTIAKIGIRQSIKSTYSCLFQTKFTSTATLAQSGDQVTATDTVSM